MKNKLYIYMGFIMATFIALIVVVVVAQNSTRKSSSSGFQKAREEAALRNGTSVEYEEELSSTSKLTSDDLDIWTLPATGRSSSSYLNSNENLSEEAIKEEEEAKEEENTPIQKAIENIPSTSELVPSLYSSEDFTRDGNKLTYYKDGNAASSFGVSISWKQGNVNMKRIKNAGSDFVFIYLGQRGFASGNIVMDENFEKNLSSALQTSMKVGVVFKSQAINKNEILEEADVIITAIKGQMISYPVVLEFEALEDDMARNDALTKDERTDLCTYFINEMSENGFDTCICGDKDFFENKISVNDLPECSIWLKEEGEAPTYEGKISFWQYETGSFNGITNDTSFLIHFNED